MGLRADSIGSILVGLVYKVTLGVKFEPRFATNARGITSRGAGECACMLHSDSALFLSFSVFPKSKSYNLRLVFSCKPPNPKLDFSTASEYKKFERLAAGSLP